MSVSDPLIKDIKGHTLKLFNESQGAEKITDSSKNLFKFCQSLEKIVYKGLIQHPINLKKINVDEWAFAIAPESNSFAYKNITEEVRLCKSVCTPLGRLRLLIRHCLMKKCIHVPFESLIRLNRMGIYYTKTSIIGHEILLAILLSVLLQCNKINFLLQLNNYYFLDSTWQLPDMIKLELVPCNNLGMSISFSDNKAVIVHIKSNSVASECTDISKGDILVNLNGIEMNSSCKGHLSSIFRYNKGQPINLVIIKAFYKETEELFSPVKDILLNLKIDVDKLKKSFKNIEKDLSATSVKIIKSGYAATYLGSADVGNKGSVKQIEEAIRHRLISAPNVKHEEQVIFEIGEMVVRVFSVATNEIILKHSYMEISSCGSVPRLPNYVAYIAGDENCDTASKFTCHIFHIKNVEEAFTILRSIGQGFCRTHFAV